MNQNYKKWSNLRNDLEALNNVSQWITYEAPVQTVFYKYDDTTNNNYLVNSDGQLVGYNETLGVNAIVYNDNLAQRVFFDEDGGIPAIVSNWGLSGSTITGDDEYNFTVTIDGTQYTVTDGVITPQITELEEHVGTDELG